MMRCATLVTGLFFLAFSANADLYFELTPPGELPHGGNSGNLPFFYEGGLDLYVWGGGDDTSLVFADFDIFAQPVIEYRALGTVDPLGLFDGPLESPGTVNGDRIENIVVTDPAGVPLPQSPADAILLYENFDVFFDGEMYVIPNFLQTNMGTNPVVHAYRIITTPEPAGVLVLCVAGAIVAGARRRL